MLRTSTKLKIAIRDWMIKLRFGMVRFLEFFLFISFQFQFSVRDEELVRTRMILLYCCTAVRVRTSFATHEARSTAGRGIPFPGRARMFACTYVLYSVLEEGNEGAVERRQTTVLKS